MSDSITIENLKAVKADKTDFGALIYFMTEQQFNYCLRRIEQLQQQVEFWKEIVIEAGIHDSSCDIEQGECDCYLQAEIKEVSDG